MTFDYFCVYSDAVCVCVSCKERENLIITTAQRCGAAGGPSRALNLIRRALCQSIQNETTHFCPFQTYVNREQKERGRTTRSFGTEKTLSDVFGRDAVHQDPVLGVFHRIGVAPLWPLLLPGGERRQGPLGGAVERSGNASTTEDAVSLTAGGILLVVRDHLLRCYALMNVFILRMSTSLRISSIPGA